MSSFRDLQTFKLSGSVGLLWMMHYHVYCYYRNKFIIKEPCLHLCPDTQSFSVISTALKYLLHLFI